MNKFFVRAFNQAGEAPSGIATGRQSVIVREMAKLGYVLPEMARIDSSSYRDLKRVTIGMERINHDDEILLIQNGFCKCGTKLLIIDDHGCCPHCDMPEPEDQHYRNHCWNCQFPIDSVYCDKSKVPGMGYHCAHCGKDLTEYKAKTSN
jgi:hypothetical protein